MSSTEGSPAVNTYHCICSALVLATLCDLDSSNHRTESSDNALVIPLRSEGKDSKQSTISMLLDVALDRRPVIIRREDGFEKRTLIRCKRCELTIGYKLDEAHFDKVKAYVDGMVYILPGGLLSTEAMKSGLLAQVPIWAQQA